MLYRSRAHARSYALSCALVATTVLTSCDFSSTATDLLDASVSVTDWALNRDDDSQDCDDRHDEEGTRSDADGDGVRDDRDNCPSIPNRNQANSNGVGPGDACELALVFRQGAGGKYAVFQSYKEPVVSSAPFQLSGSPDLLRVSAKAPRGAQAYQGPGPQRLGVKSPGERTSGDAESIGPGEMLQLAVGSAPALAGAKATEVWLRLDGASVVEVTLWDGATQVTGSRFANLGADLEHFDALGRTFDRVDIRVQSGRVSLRGPNEAVLFALDVQPSCPSGYQRVGASCVDIDECAAATRLCDSLATCTNTPGSYTCGPCPSGYTGSGATGCVDIDECATGADACSDLAACTNTPGSYTCGACPSGYDGDGRTCSDIDECALGLDVCDALVTCTNTPGSYVCGDCPTGFSGGGQTGCVDIDECEGANRVCDPLTTCTNAPGSFTCGLCPTGYEGNGVDGCVDVDECAQNLAQCSPLVTCSNTAGGYQCGSCPAGYRGDGHTCTDVDECAENLDQCSDLVTCTNTSGSYTCGACPSGYAGDGVTCADVDECQGAPCDSHTACTNTVGAYTCSACPAGYTGDGYAGCVDVDECNLGTDDCSPLVTCANTDGGYQCAPCPSGYEGDGKTCTDIDECAANSDDCDARVTCTNTDGSFHCGTCPNGYAGNGHSCEDVDECQQNPCDSLTACTNLDGTYSCSSCPDGYTGNGYQGCLDIDECAVENGGCPLEAACENTVGSRSCRTCASSEVGRATHCGLGACASMGTTVCVLGNVVDTCTPGEPSSSDSTCDGVDDDCDGLTDEDHAPVASTCGVGSCTASGVRACVGGVMEDSCTPGVPAASDASCDARDEDCDRATDEDYSPVAVSCGTGACARSGLTRCEAGAVTDNCSPGQPAPSDNNCDGIDDDCDGVADEDFVEAETTCGVGACGARGVLLCTGGALLDTCQPGQPAAVDGCGNGDEDCDGFLDEDCCQPSTCNGVGANCGTVSDGCGGLLDCGSCAAPEVCGGAGPSNVCGVPDLPPAPEDVAPRSTTGDFPSSPFDSIAFLFSGDNPIQRGVTPGAVERHRFATLGGRVLKADGTPLSGVRVSVLHRPELGFTLSRSDGEYDLACNGGEQVTLVLTRPGYLGVHRTLRPEWESQQHVDDVVLQKLAETSTPIQLSHPGTQTIVADETQDDDGPRRAVLHVPAGLTAAAEVDSQLIPLSAMTVRVTEVTTLGPAGMPAALPEESLYTYAAEISVDEVGPDTPVFLSKPIAYYVDNFLDFPTGVAIPHGVYDRSAGRWVPDDDGVVVRIVAIHDGLADLDIDFEDPLAETSAELEALGIDDAERRMLAARYEVGKSLWRVAIDHFSLQDFNLSPVQAPPPEPPKPVADLLEPRCPDQATGSIINCQGRKLGENIPLDYEQYGNSYRLHYQADKTVGGSLHKRARRIPLPAAPDGALHQVIEVYVGRRLVDWERLPAGQPYYDFIWDGLDAYKQPAYSAVRAYYTIDYDLAPEYATTTFSAGGRSFGGGRANACSGGRSRSYVRTGNRVSRTPEPFTIGSFTNEAFKLGGWSLEHLHFYDPISGELHYGNGRTRSVRSDRLPIGIMAGRRSDDLPNTELEVGDAEFGDLHRPTNPVAGPDGTVYFRNDSGSAGVPGRYGAWYAITPDGALRQFATNLWNQRPLRDFARMLGVDSMGRIYVATVSNRLYRIQPSGQNADPLADTWTAEYVLGPAPNANSGPFWRAGMDLYGVDMGSFEDLALASDGSLYVLTKTTTAGIPNGLWVYRVRADNRAELIFSDSHLAGIAGIAMTKDNRLLIASDTDKRVYAIGVTGGRETVAGNGTSGFAPDDEHSPLEFGLGGTVYEIEVAGDRIYLIASGAGGKKRVTEVRDGTARTVFLDGLPRPAWMASTAFSDTPYGAPAELVGLPDGRLAITELTRHRIVEINSTRPRSRWEDEVPGPTDLSTVELKCFNLENGNELGCPCDPRATTPCGTRAIRRYFAAHSIRYEFPSEDGSEWYSFDDAGRHRATYDTTLGTRTFQFSYRDYDSSEPGHSRTGGLRFFEDTTTPWRRRVEMEPRFVDPPDFDGGYLYAYHGFSFEYGDGGLLTRMWDRRANRDGPRSGNGYSFTWDHVQRPGQATTTPLLQRDTDPTGASQSFTSESPEPTYAPIYGAYSMCYGPIITDWVITNQTATVARTSQEGRVTTYRTRKEVVNFDASAGTYDGFKITAEVEHPSGLMTSRVDPDAQGNGGVSTGPGFSRTFTEAHDPRLGSNSSYESASTTSIVALTSDGGSSAAPRSRAALSYSVTTTRSVDGGSPLDPLAYDALTQSTSLTAGGLSARTFTSRFDRLSRTVTMTSPEGRSSTIKLDRSGRVVETAQPGQVPVVVSYPSQEGQGTITTVSRERSATERREVRIENGNSQHLAPRNVTSRVSADRETSVEFRSFWTGFVNQVTTPSGETALEPDESGLTTSVTTTLGQRHEFGHDLLGRLASYAPPGTTATDEVTTLDACPIGVQCYLYTPERNLHAVVLPDGSALNYAYEASTGLLSSVSVPGRGSRALGYDANGLLINASSEDGGMLSLAYQAALPVRTSWSGTRTVKDGAATVWVGAINGEVKAYYNNFLEVESLRIVSGFGAKFNRDRDGLITSIANVLGGTTVPALTVNRSALDGRETGTAQGVVTTTSAYDIDTANPGFGDLQGLDARAGTNALFHTAYERDDLARIVRLSETVLGEPRTRRFDYDDSGRLEVVRDDGGNELTRYSYDANGNRAGVSSAGVTTAASCGGGGAANNADQLCSYGAYSYTYDANGYLANTVGPEGQTRYTYDGTGLLHKVALPGGDTIYYLHDGLGRRVAKLRKTAGSSSATLVKGWLYAGSLHPIAELDSAGAVESTFVYGTRANIPDYIVRKSGTTQVTYRVIADHLGTPRLVVNAASGAVAQRLDLDEFGRVTSDTNPGFQPFGFAGGLYDADTGLVRFGARDYDAFTGRWTARDPILFAGGDTNLYAYVGGDPVNRRDPTGLVLEVNGDSTAVWNAIDYLRRDPGMAAMIDRLESSSNVYTIQVNDHQFVEYSPEDMAVSWDPHVGAASEYGENIGPELVLGHELAHADGGSLINWLGAVWWPDYGNLEERRVITGLENAAAITLGEGVRTSHYGEMFCQ